MLSINLLPSQERQVVRMEEALRLIVFFTLSSILAFVVGFVFLMPSFLSTYLAEQELIRSLQLEEEIAEHQGVRGVMLKARKVHEMISEIRAYATDPARASLILERFFDSSEGITIQSFSIRKNGDITLAGHADTRSSLLQFEGALRGSNRFHEITLPLSNITRERDIQFTVQGKLKKEHGL